MVSVVDNLKCTQKGRLKYNPRPDMGELMLQLSPPPLSRSHAESPSSMSHDSFKSLDADSTLSNSSLSYYSSHTQLETPESRQSSYYEKSKLYANEEEKEKGDISKDDLKTFASPSCLNRSQNASSSKSPESVLSPEWGESSLAVHKDKMQRELLLQLKNSERTALYLQKENELEEWIQKQYEERTKRITKQLNERQAVIERKRQERSDEARRQEQKLLENQKEQANKLIKIEREKELLEQEERKRQFVKQLDSMLRTLENEMETFLQLYNGCPHKDLLPNSVDNDRALLQNFISDLQAQIQAAVSSQSVSPELILKSEDQKMKKSQAVVDQLKKLIEETNAKVKTEEENKKEEQKKLQALQKQEEAKKKKEAETDFRVQAFKYTLEEMNAKAKRLQEVEASIKPFVDNVQMKKYRFDLQRAVNTSINAISGINGLHLLDKLKKLHMLLSGQRVEVSGKHVSAKDAPEALLFCQNLVAKMLVKKGEEQVTSKHESAFAIAAVAVGLWVSFPVVGELFLAHLQAQCPYVLPYYTTRDSGQSSTDYFKSAGYRINDDGSVEEQDKFLRRMSGLMRLYAACMVVSPPNLGGSGHPHGLEHAWMWLSRAMNLDPHPDITSAVIYDMLSVTGHFLFKQYKVQFVKLLYVLCKSYFPLMKNVSVTSATLGRLEVFLENSLQKASIPPPDGILAPDFWSTS